MVEYYGEQPAAKSVSHPLLCLIYEARYCSSAHTPRPLEGSRSAPMTGWCESVPNAPSRPGNGIALRNVRDRLRLMHDVAAQFEARREDDVFRVQIVLPLSK